VPGVEKINFTWVSGSPGSPISNGGASSSTGMSTSDQRPVVVARIVVVVAEQPDTAHLRVAVQRQKVLRQVKPGCRRRAFAFVLRGHLAIELHNHLFEERRSLTIRHAPPRGVPLSSVNWFRVFAIIWYGSYFSSISQQ